MQPDTVASVQFRLGLHSCPGTMASGYVQCMNYAEGLHFSAFHFYSVKGQESHHAVTGYPRTKGQESVYETCACVIHSATCALVLSFHINVCAGYMCFVKL